MSWFDEVEREVRGFSAGGIKVASYRLALVETAQTQLGIESNRLGSAYAPVTTSDLSGGGFLIQWSDGLLSRGSLSRAPREALREVLLSGYEGRYEDPEEANFPAEAEVPPVPLFSAEAAAVAEGEAQTVLPGLLGVLRFVGESHGVRLLDAGGRAVRGRRRVVSSGGFRAESEATSLGFHLSFDSLVADGYGSRSPLSAEEVVIRAERTAEDFEGLRNPAGEEPRGRTEVVLHPRVAEDFLRTFLLGNLSGGSVANGRSRFVPEDFREGRLAFREDLSVSARPLAPMGIGSFRFTDEGVAAHEVDFIREGRLRSPVLGLKYARRLDMAPAAAPPAIEGYEITLGSELTREEALASGESRIVVHSVMGMHTQDSVRGDYSVLAPQCALFRDGRCLGRVSATLNGSFFENLKSPALRLVRFAGFACPGLLLEVELS